MSTEDCTKMYHTDPCGGGCYTPINKDARIAELEAQLRIAVDELTVQSTGIRWCPDTAIKREINSIRDAATEALTVIKAIGVNNG